MRQAAFCTLAVKRVQRPAHHRRSSPSSSSSLVTIVILCFRWLVGRLVSSSLGSRFNARLVGTPVARSQRMRHAVSSQCFKSMSVIGRMSRKASCWLGSFKAVASSSGVSGSMASSSPGAQRSSSCSGKKKPEGVGEKRVHRREDKKQGGGPPRKSRRLPKTAPMSDICTCSCGSGGTIVASLQTGELPNT